MAITTEACPECRKLFLYPGVGPKICQACQSKDESQFSIIRNYLRENGSANAQELELATGIPAKVITGYLRAGRLEIPENSNAFIKCECCGTDIKSGKYCTECATRMHIELTSACVGLIGEKPKSSERMRFLGRKG